ncbi:MAG: endolytic transglycosylase MltG, partial [Patescibacteria group bacterium]
LKAGRYIFKPGDNLLTVVHLIASGLAESEDILVTIPEGFNIWEIDQKFNQVGLIGKGGISRNFIHKEGHLFPDTYRFKKGTNPEGIVSKMEENYFKKGGTRSDEVIIIASLLEKEAKTKEDMELVAGIIYKRLKLGIPLQVDASVSYGWCLRNFEISVYPLRSRLSEASRNIGYCDVAQAPLALEIKIDGPYNTYIRLGLPPGAISNPGFVALEAAQNPKSSDYLYYLSTRDGNQIIYSKTASEHSANRNKYLGI